jgi:hypothetical protein
MSVDETPKGQGAPELLPCPFCGGKGHIHKDPDTELGDFYCIKCSKCRAKSPEFYARETCPIFYGQVRDAWNTRAELLTAAQARAEQAEAEVAKTDALMAAGFAEYERRLEQAEAEVARLRNMTGRLKPQDVEWVVNDLAELGVKIGDQFFFLYKGYSLQYGDSDPTVPPVHEETDLRVGYKEGDPLKWRPVFKREFGECCHPINRADPKMIGTVSLDDSEDWRDLPAVIQQTPALSEGGKDTAQKGDE